MILRKRRLRPDAPVCRKLSTVCPRLPAAGRTDRACPGSHSLLGGRSMLSSLTRRSFMANTLRAGAVLGLGDLAFLKGLGPVSADEAKLSPGKIRLNSDIEPLVRLIEDTPRDKLLEAVAERLRQGLGYQQLMTGLFLAGVRSIQPRPVGFKFHAVLVVNSAHLASQAGPDN